VRLNSTGQFVEFTSTNQANSIVVRNSIPDAPGGGGQEATISLYVNGTVRAEADAVVAQQLAVRHHRRHRVAVELARPTRAGCSTSRTRCCAVLPGRHEVQAAARRRRHASFYIIDLIDLEQVAPALSQPAGCVSITSTARCRTTASTTRPPSSGR
jgi:hypothetical protein